MDWNKISTQPKLSEDFMREHAEQLDWFPICFKQHLSLSFLTEMIEYISLNIIRHRIQIGTLPHINQETFTKLEQHYREHWSNKIRIAGGTTGIRDKEKIKIAFTLDGNTFPSSRFHTRLAIIFQLDENVSEVGITGISRSTLDREAIPLSSLFLTDQQKQAFFYCLNSFLLQHKFIEKPITFVIKT